MSLAKSRVGGTWARTRPRIIASAICPAPRNAMVGSSLTAGHPLVAYARERASGLYSLAGDVPLMGVAAIGAVAAAGVRPAREVVGERRDALARQHDRRLVGEQADREVVEH